MISIIFITLLGAILLNNFLKKQRFISHDIKKFNSLTTDYSYCFILWNLIAIIFINFFLNYKFYTKISLLLTILIFNFFLINFLHKAKFNAKKHFENFQINILKITTIIGIIITIVITITILLETLKFFKIISPTEFFLKTSWNPQNSINSEQEVGESSFGILPVFLGTFLITLIAMIIAVPIGIMSAIYLSMYSSSKSRDILKPIIEILAGVPTVVYGYFAVTTIAPLLDRKSVV